eukprot:CAMPEP_0202484060 /NCGR_PEP_ID=MMETSP1361-20130828/3206_1 /ASSEMBLY_ACC=CAM_ASM_000849 /TAXON_ID=210615 /ORGANISM="Staurosira complex sp., Strain CCMP2646" /LENGTH=187 /DNA_ID=CAMNT_0049112565 /DNA_START=48 /DNA_END=611 /DNA_ORIENTATION=-
MSPQAHNEDSSSRDESESQHFTQRNHDHTIATTDKEDTSTCPPNNIYTSTDANTSSSCVKFGSVHVISHSVRLGDNPSVSEGLPIALGSKRGSAHFGTVDEFETQKGKPKPAIKLSKEARNVIILRNGHSRSSLVMARKQVKDIKLSRLESNKDSMKSQVKKGKTKPLLLLPFLRKKNKRSKEERQE